MSIDDIDLATDRLTVKVLSSRRVRRTVRMACNLPEARSRADQARISEVDLRPGLETAWQVSNAPLRPNELTVSKCRGWASWTIHRPGDTLQLASAPAIVVQVEVMIGSPDQGEAIGTAR